MNQVYLIILVVFAVLFMLFMMRVDFLRRRDLMALEKAHKSKSELARNVFYHPGTEIPNHHFFGHKVLSVEREYAVYHLSLIKLGRAGVFQSLEHNKKDIQQLFDQIRDATLPFAIALKDHEFILMAFVSHGNSLNHKLARQKQQEILRSLPQKARVNGKWQPIDYAIISLSLTGDSPIYGIDKVERRLRFAMKYALENESGHFYHNEKLYRAQMFKKHILRGLSRSVAFKDRDFYVVFQPIFHQDDLETPIRFESLIRWRNPNNIGPGIFIPLVQKMPKLQNDLTKVVLNQVAVLLKAQLDVGEKPVPVHVNISAEQLSSDAFTRHIAALLKKVPGIANYVTFEIIETSKIVCSKALSESIEKFKRFGFAFAIDDFGQGNANFDWLHEPNFDVLKIDKEYIAKITRETDTSTLLDKVIELGQSCGLSVVIEGVETKQQLDYLSKFDDILIQGFYASKPVQANRYINWLSTNHTVVH